MAVITVSTRKAWANGDMRVGIRRENAGQFEAFVAATHHLVGGFKIEEQTVIQPVDQCCRAKGTRNLRNDVREYFASIKAGEQPQRERDGRVQVSTGNGGGQIDGHCHPQAPNDADFPLAEAGTCQFQRCNTAYAKENQQTGAEEFSDALAFKVGLMVWLIILLSCRRRL